MKRGAEIIATQVRLFEIELGEGMRAIDNRFDATRPRHLADSFDRRDLAGDINLVRNLNQTRARRDGAFERRRDFVDVLWRDRDLDQV